MSPPQQPPSVTAAEKIVPSSSTTHASSVTVTPSVTVPVVPTLPSPVTEAITTEAEQNLPTPMTEKFTGAPSAPSAPVLVPGSGSMEDIVIEVEQKLTPITAAPAPVTATPSVDVPVVLSSVAAPVNDPPPAVVRERLSPTMAIKIESMMKLSSYMWQVPLLIFLISILFLKAASKTVDNIIFYTLSSMMCSWSIILTCFCFKTLDVNIPCWFFHFVMLGWNLIFLTGLCSLVAAFYYLITYMENAA